MTYIGRSWLIYEWTTDISINVSRYFFFWTSERYLFNSIQILPLIFLNFYCVISRSWPFRRVREDLTFTCRHKISWHFILWFYELCPLIQWNHYFFRYYVSLLDLSLDGKDRNLWDFFQKDSRSTLIMRKTSSRCSLLLQIGRNMFRIFGVRCFLLKLPNYVNWIIVLGFGWFWYT
jgi:hypothetical protein